MRTFEQIWADRRMDVEKMARRLLKGYGGEAIVDSLVAAGMVALWEACKSYDHEMTGKVSLWSWARKLIYWAMCAELRGDGDVHERAPQFDGEKILDDAPTPEERLCDEELRLWLRTSIPRLPKEERAAVEAYLSKRLSLPGKRGSYETIRRRRLDAIDSLRKLAEPRGCGTVGR